MNQKIVNSAKIEIEVDSGNTKLLNTEEELIRRSITEFLEQDLHLKVTKFEIHA